MAVQVNVFGQQVGAADLLTADERLANIQNAIYRQQSMSNFQTIEPNYISNQSIFARESGVPEFVDNSWAVGGGVALDREEVLKPGGPRNVAPVDVRQEQLIRSANRAGAPKQTLSAATGFSPAVQMLIDAEIQRTGIDPTEGLTEEQLQAARQIGVIPRKHGVTPYSKSGGGNQNQLSPLWGDIARFFEPSMDPEEIVGEPESSEPAIIPAGEFGILQKALSNVKVESTGQANLGQNTPADRDVLLRSTEFLRDVREQMSEALFNASIDKTDPENPRTTAVGRAIEQEYGVGHYNNPSLAGIGAVAYYTALNDSRYADFSKEEKADHKVHRMRHGENHPDLYSSDSFGGNRPMRTRQLAHLEDEIGSAMEVVQQMKFKNPKNKQIISQVIKNAMADMGRAYSLVVPKTEYMSATSGPVPLVFNPAEIRAGAAEGFFPIEGITFQKRMGKSRLGKLMGVLMELQPAKRKNSSFVPLPEIALNEKNPNQPRTIKGVSAVRNWMVNFTQSIPNKLDPYVLNLLTYLILIYPFFSEM